MLKFFLLLIRASLSLAIYFHSQPGHGTLLHRPSSTHVDHRLELLDQYDGQILIGGELEKFPDELFMDVTLDEAIQAINEIVSLDKMIRIINKHRGSFGLVKFRNKNLLELESEDLMTRWQNPFNEEDQKRTLSLMFACFRTWSGNTFDSPIIKTKARLSKKARELLKIEFGEDGPDSEVIEIRHKKPFKSIREFYNNIITVNGFFGLEPDEVDHIHLSILKTKNKNSWLGSPQINLREILEELNKLRFLESIQNSWLQGEVSPQLKNPYSAVSFSPDITEKGLYRLISPNHFEIRVLRKGILDELQFHLYFLTMPESEAIPKLQERQRNILKNSEIIRLIQTYRPWTLPLFSDLGLNLNLNSAKPTCKMIL